MSLYSGGTTDSGEESTHKRGKILQWTPNQGRTCREFDLVPRRNCRQSARSLLRPNFRIEQRGFEERGKNRKKEVSKGSSTAGDSEACRRGSFELAQRRGQKVEVGDSEACRRGTQEVGCGEIKGCRSKRSSRPAFHSRKNLAGFELIAAGVVVAEKKTQQFDITWRANTARKRSKSLEGIIGIPESEYCSIPNISPLVYRTKQWRANAA
ncbi:hypothetical protein BKA61DRAFT_648865 [Leptodontidium sp. MPI-SDFR-AT-0119]|nr:hypothetical protein BKA61DRAFT_648865 [Leptodontidium sp. MPI-SDFR-AT-0119]